MSEDIFTLKNQADTLIKQNLYSDALPLYKKLWEQQSDQPDKWIGWRYAHCLRKIGKSFDALNVCRDVYRIDPEFDHNNNLYGWCIYDMGIKQPEDRFDENEFLKAANAIVQITQQGQYSPFEITVLAVIHYFEKERKGFDDSRNLTSGDFKRMRYLNEQILLWLDHLDVSKLSMQSDKKPDGSSFPSHREDWYNSRARALLALEQHQECAQVCTSALTEIKELHNGYDVWFRWYGAQSHIALGEYDRAIDYLQYILQQKQDFWIRRVYAQCLKEMGRLDDSIQQLAIIALPNKGLGFRWEVYLDLGITLAEMGDIEHAQQHVLLAAAIRQDEGWEKIPQNLHNAIQDLGLSAEGLPKARTLHRDLKDFWMSMTPAPQTTHTGEITHIHSNGKSGFVRSHDGETYFFSMRNYTDDAEARVGLQVVFNLKESVNKNTGKQETHAVDIQAGGYKE